MMPKSPKVLLVDPCLDDSLEWAKDRLRQALPGAEVIVFSAAAHKQTVYRVWHRLWQTRMGAFDYVVVPIRRHFLKCPSFVMSVFWAQLFRIGVLRMITESGNLFHPVDLMLVPRVRWLFLLLQPIFSAVIFLRLPFLVVRQLFGKFMLTPEDPKDEFVGFGEGKGVGGLVYWLAIVRKTVRYGLLGLASDVYMGMPISVHTWPLAVALLGKLGYRRYIYLSTALFGLGLTWLCFSSGHIALTGFIPIILLSTYYIFNIYVGTLELLAWSCGILTIASSYDGFPVLAGIFLAATMLVHPLVCGLVGATLMVFGFVEGRAIFDLVVVISVAGGMTAWFIIPFWRARGKLGRNALINSRRRRKRPWDLGELYQLIIYALICILVLLVPGPNHWSIAILVLPLIVHYYNTRQRWVFSKYTVLNYMLFSGAVYICLFPSVPLLLGYLLVIFTSPKLLWGSSADLCREFDLTPVTLGKTREKVRNAFLNLQGGRVAFEAGLNNEKSEIVSAFGYILSDVGVDLLNAGYTEIGDRSIYENYIQVLNSRKSRSEFERACLESGTKYIAAFSDDLYNILTGRGYRKIVEVEDLNLAPYPRRPRTKVAIFELPWEPAAIFPPTKLHVSRNQIKFNAKQGQAYRLAYTAFKGWRAFQNGKRISILDAKPGILIQPMGDGEVTLRYRYWHYYWL